MSLMSLFLSFLQVGLFSIGGGYAAIPLIQAQVVEKFGWITMGEFTDLVTIAEMTPGPIAINAATFTGIKIGGIAGSVVATFGCILPSLIIVTVLAIIYYKNRSAAFMQSIFKTIRPVVVSLIASAGIKILINTAHIGHAVDWKAVVMFVLSFTAIRTNKINPVLVMLTAGVLYMLIGLII